MDEVLGLAGMVVFIAVVIAFAAAVTWLVVKVDGLIRGRRSADAPAP